MYLSALQYFKIVFHVSKIIATAYWHSISLVCFFAMVIILKLYMILLMISCLKNEVPAAWFIGKEAVCPCCGCDS